MSEPASRTPNGPIVLVYPTRAFTFRAIRVGKASAADLSRWSTLYLCEDLTRNGDVEGARKIAAEWCDRWLRAQA